MKDIGGVEIPETLAKLAGVQTEPAAAAPTTASTASASALPG